MKVLDGRWAPWLLGSFLVVGLAWPALDPAVQLFYRDTGRLYYELKLFIAAQLTQGQSPFWDPWVESGTPILTQVAPGLFHPLTLLYLAPFDLAFKLNHLLALPLAFASMVLLCRKTGASRWAAAAAAAAYAGSGWVVSMTNCNLTYALSAGAIPLALHGLLRFVERPRPLRLLWASYALALCFYGGDPQSMLFAGALGAAWVLGAKRSWRSLAEVAAWGFCAILLAAPAVLPVLPRLLQSSRSSGLSEQELATFANKPQRLFGLGLPRAFDVYASETAQALQQPFSEYFAGPRNDAFADTFAIGMPALLLAYASRKRGRWALLGAAVFTFASTGGAALTALSWVMPGLSMFRYAEKLIAPATLLFCLAAAWGADSIATPGGARSMALFSGAAATALLAARAALVLLPFEDFLRAQGATHAAAPATLFETVLSSALLLEAALCALLALVSLLQIRRQAFPAVAAVALICAAAAQCQAGGTIAAAPVQLFRGPVPLADALRALAGPSTERWRTRAATPGSLLIDGFPTRMRPWIGGQQMLDPMFNQLAAVESVASYTPLADLDYETAYLFAPSALSQTMGVRFDIQGPTEMAPEAAARNGYRRRGPYGAWVKEFPARPRAFLAACARTAVSRDEALHLLSHGAFQVREAVLRKEVQLPCPAAPAPAVDLERHAPDSLRATFVASARSVLVVSEHYDSGWRATLDGAPAEVLQANLSALAVVVPAGAHAVELRYQPPWLLPGLLLALACALALGLLEFLEKDHRVGAAEAE